MPFNIEGAKKSGYSDSEIAEYLAKQSNFDITGARNSGYKDDEIINHLSVKPQMQTDTPLERLEAQPTTNIPFGQPDFKAMVNEAEKPMIDLNRIRKSDTDYLSTPIEVPEEAPGWAKSYPGLYSKIVKTKDVIAPTAQTVANYGGMALGPLGAGFANMQEQAAERLFDTYMGRQKPLPLKEDLMQYTRDFGWGELGGTLERGFKGLFKRPTPEALVAKEQAEAIGVKPLPSEIRESKTLANLEAGMGRLFGSSSILTNYDRKNVQAIIREAQNIAESSGTKIQPEDLGRIIYDKVDDYLTSFVTKNETELTKLRAGIKNTIGSNLSRIKLSEGVSTALKEGNEAAYQKGQKLYAARDALITPGEFIPHDNTLKVSEKWLDILSKQPSVDRDPKLIGRLTHITRNWGWKGDPIPYQEMADMKSNIWADLRTLNPGMEVSPAGVKGLTKAGSSMEVRAYSELINAIERDANAYARGKGTGLLEASQEANTYYGQFKRLTNEIKGLLKQKPERVLDRIKDVNDVRLVKRAITQQQFDSLIKPAFTNRLLGGEGQSLNPKYTSRMMSKYADVLPEVYNSQELELLETSVTKGMGYIGKPMNKVNTKFLEKIIESGDPKAIIDSFYTAGKSKYSGHNFRLIYHIMGRKKDIASQAKMRYFLAKKILFDGQQIDPASLLSGSKEYGGFGFARLNKNIQNNEHLLTMMTGKNGFTEDSINRLKRLTNIGKYMQSVGRYAPLSIKETGQVTWAMSQVLTSLAAIRYGNIPEAMGILFGPAATTAVYLTKPARELMIKGLPRTGMAKGLGLRATRLLNPQPIQFQESQEK